MISGEQIADLIKEPKKVNKEHLSDLDALIEKYPYCSSLYILQIIGSNKTSAINFEEKLKIAASHVSDRAQLHSWIEDVGVHQQETEVKKEVIQHEEETSSEEKEVVAIAEQDEVVESKAESREANEEKAQNPTEEVELSELNAEIMSSVVEAALSQEIEQEIEQDEIEAAKIKAKEKEERAKQQIEEALALIEQRKAEEEEKKKKKAAKAAKKKAKKEKKKAAKKEQKAVDEKKETAKKSKVTQKKEIKQPSNMTFIEWLKYKQQLANGEVKEMENVLEETNEPLTSTAFDFTELEEIAPVTGQEKVSKKDINELLDKFIEGDPKLEPKGQAFFDPSENAKKSVEDSTDIVSETLAEIHVMQGNYEKAISAYKQLMNVYPEKKAIFAARIEKIEEKLNN